MEEINTEEQNKKNKWKGYLKKIGLAGFIFFLVKGLIWIAVFIIGAKGCNSLMD